MTRNNIRYDIFLFSILILFAILLRLIFSTGLYLSADDYFYSKAAYEISEGNFNTPSNHWNARIGHTTSIAFSYWLFGVNEYSAIFSTIFFSVLNIILIFLLCKELFQNSNFKLIALFASIFFTFLPISIAEGSSLSMHQGAAFFMFLSFYCMLLAERTRHMGWYIASGLLAGIAYLFHETGAYIFIPIALFYLAKRRLQWKALIIPASFLLVIGAETLIYYELTDKLFYRQTLSMNPLEKRIEIRVTEDMGFLEKLDSLKSKVISNPLKGTFIGDSWLLEPFRWSFLDPANSILYHIILILSIMLLIQRDRQIMLLLIMFLGLYLYIAYGSPNPLSYEPLRRIPRYTLPTSIIGSIIAGYGLYKLSKRMSVTVAVLALYITISILSISIKGGEVGQRLHQAKNFYNYMLANPDKRYLTDINTLNGIEYISQYKYKNKFDISGMKPRDFAVAIKETDPGTDETIFLINVPENFPRNIKEYEILNNEVSTVERFNLVQSFDRKKRKICHINFVFEKLSESLCNISNGGRIYTNVTTSR
jgi:hypothetical protein